MTLEENKAIVRRQFDLIQAGTIDALDEVMASDMVNHAVGRAQSGLESFKAILRGLRQAFPDETTTIDDIIAEGDKVVVRATAPFGLLRYGRLTPTLVSDRASGSSSSFLVQRPS